MNLAEGTASLIARNAVSASVLAALAVSVSLWSARSPQLIRGLKLRTTPQDVVVTGTAEYENIVKDIELSTIHDDCSKGIVFAHVEGGRATKIEVEGDARVQHCATLAMQAIRFRVVEPFDVMIPID
jgi:hypothetical protein